MSQHDQGNDSSGGGGGPGGDNKKGKRRSKNDTDGRDHKCPYCDKTYLSYPALYTHLKTKHAKGPDGTPLPLNSGRGRGRPKKNQSTMSKVDPTTDDYFNTVDKKGGPTDPLSSFEETIKSYFGEKKDSPYLEDYTKYPMYKPLKDF